MMAAVIGLNIGFTFCDMCNEEPREGTQHVFHFHILCHATVRFRAGGSSQGRWMLVSP